MKRSDPNRFSTADIAELCGVGQRSVNLWVRENLLPDPVEVRGRKRLWDRSQVEQIVKQFRRVKPTIEVKVAGGIVTNIISPPGVDVIIFNYDLKGDCDKEGVPCAIDVVEG